jgi:Ca2+-binding RTX toxin-like protein
MVRRSPPRTLAVRALALTLFTALVGCGAEEPTGSAPELSAQRQALTAPAWQSGKAYAAGDLVSSGGKVYRCVQPHTSQPGWNPEAVPALWGFEGIDQPADPTLPTTPPATGLTFDYVTLEADCDENPSSCCQTGSTVRSLTESADTQRILDANQCVLAFGGRDTIFLQSPGPSSLLLGSGDDVAMDGAADDLIWGGPGNDTINGHGGTNLFFGGYGDDTIHAANGNNTVVPGPGADNVACGTGDDTVHIFDVCEIGWGERIDGGTGNDTLIIPVSLEELRALGVTVANFDNIVVRPQPCRSQCADPATCDQCPENDDKMDPGECGCASSDIDRDKDGVADCKDGCDLDKRKTEQGVCGCGVPDVDTNKNGAPDCSEPQDPNNPGNPRPDDECGEVGAACTGGACRGVQVCRANGECGNPGDCMPDDGCRFVRFQRRGFWFCPNGRTRDDAEARCAQEQGRHLIDIDDEVEAALVHFNVSTPIWTGGHDRGADGTFRWSDGSLFWQAGKSYQHRYTRWASGEPRTGSDDCVSLGADRLWRTLSCAESLGYVCEVPEHIPLIGEAPDPRDTSEINGTDGKDDHDEANCVAESVEFPTFETGEVLRTRVRACQDANCGGQPCDQCTRPDAFIGAVDQCNAGCTDPDNCACGGGLEVPSGFACEQTFTRDVFGYAPASCAVDSDCPDEPAEDVRHDRISTWPVCTARAGTSATVCGMRELYPSASAILRMPATPRDCVVDAECEPAEQIDPDVTTRAACVAIPQPDQTNKRECRMVDLYPAHMGIREGVTEAFPPDLCDETSLCGEPIAEQTVQTPNDNGDPLDEVVDPDTFLPDAPERPEEEFARALDLPTCPSGDCAGPKHPWCRYDVTDRLDERRPEAPAPTGESGSAISFAFTPSFAMSFGGADGQPDKPIGAFGIPNAKLTASASAVASATLTLPLMSPKVVPILDASAGLDAGLSAERCGASGQVKVMIFGLDFLPGEAGEETWPAEADEEACRDAIADVQESVNRVQKAYHDALELYRQYKERRESRSPDDDFGTRLCETLFKGEQAPVDFGDSMDNPCPANGESPERTINRFIEYYARTLGLTLDQATLDGMKRPSLKKAVSNLEELFQNTTWNQAQFPLYTYPSETEQHTLFNQQFFVGPVPCNLEVYLTTEYGIDVKADLRFNPASAMATIINPGCDPNRTPCETYSPAFATATAMAVPHAGVGLGMFAGVGFSVNGFTTKLGIQGDLSLGKIEINGHVGTHLALASTPDSRRAPVDLTELFPESWGGENQVATRLLTTQIGFTAGLGVHLRDILSGSVSAKLKIKIAFFSKSWSKRLFKFDGVCAGSFGDPLGGMCDLALFGDVNEDVLNSKLKDWGSVRMPAPFATIPKLEVPTYGPAGPITPPKPGATDDGIFERVEEFFYDSLCQCAETSDEPRVPADPAQGCYRDADCCDEDAYCFLDPLRAADRPWGVCVTEKRRCGETCGKASDCFVVDDGEGGQLEDIMKCVVATGTIERDFPWPDRTETTSFCMIDDHITDLEDESSWCNATRRW